MSYGVFAEYYDKLMQDVDYGKIASFVDVLFKEYGNNVESVLDVACGTGSLTCELNKLGYDMIGADASQEMLSIAKNKDNAEGILYLCQEMDELDLYGTVNGAVCSLDSINHITDIQTVKNAFKKISLFLDNGGIFIFDVNTIYKHREILGNNSFVYDLDDLYCVWQNYYYEEDNSVDIDLDFFAGHDGNYKRFHEEFSERAYSEDELEKMLSNADFEVLDKFDGMSRNPVLDFTERIVYVARKK